MHQHVLKVIAFQSGRVIIEKIENQQSMSNLVGGTYRDNGFAVTLEQFSQLALDNGVPGTWVSVLGRNFGVNGRAVTDFIKIGKFSFCVTEFC